MAIKILSGTMVLLLFRAELFFRAVLPFRAVLSFRAIVKPVISGYLSIICYN